MNSKQRKQFRRYVERTMGDILENRTAGDITKEFLFESQRLVVMETEVKRLRVKIGDQYGDELCGQWFYLVPADGFAEIAIQKHLGVVI